MVRLQPTDNTRIVELDDWPVFANGECRTKSSGEKVVEKRRLKER